VTQFRVFLATQHFGLSIILLSNTGELSAAEVELGKALAIRQKLADDNPAIPQFQIDLADLLGSSGWRLAQ
jgi:hypothetical protein